MKVSIIIPSFNEEQNIVECITSLGQQTKPHELIIVDDGSTDDTVATLTQLHFLNSKLVLLQQNHLGPGAARNTGAKQSTGEILVFVDDDIKADSGWLKAIAAAFNDQQVHLVGGKCLPEFETHVPEWLQGFWKHDTVGDRCPWLSLMDLGEQKKEIDPIFVWGLNYSIRKKTLYDLGGFHPDNIPARLQYLQGDGETGLSQKIKAKGYKAIYEPNASVKHVIPASRLTSEYFEKRAFYEGVCGSYSAIRKSGKIPADPPITEGETSIFSKAKSFVNSLFTSEKGPTGSADFKEILAKTKKSYIRGYNFHQNAVKEHPELLIWILKEDYFDYKLPIINLNHGRNKK